MKKKDEPFKGGLFQHSASRYTLIFCLDILFIMAAFSLAYDLRFEGEIPSDHIRNMMRLMPWLLGTRLTAIILLQMHRWSFRYAGFHDAVRVGMGIVAGSILFLAAIVVLLLPFPPRSIIALEFFLSAIFLGGYRFMPRLLNYIWVEKQRTNRKAVRKTIIVGAGSAGELLLRDLRHSGEHNYRVMGFVDDDPGKIGKIIGRQKVLGALEDIPKFVSKMQISDVLIAIPRLDTHKVKKILDQCKNLKIRYKILPVSFAYIEDKISASMLQDLQPVDLLARDSVPFEEKEIRELVEGRSALVTGAAGSIGGEICRQLARYGAKQIVLSDINENELYFLYRELMEDFPEVKVHAEVTDIRDRERVFALGRQFSPRIVLHAAAHKHVPLMETAPEEAVKNNVVGTKNVVDMAVECGAEKFVLISTDKAVKPKSVMGVSKRVAEFIVRESGRRSKAHFSAVRFGNVLGSAGSVVPLFKKQIAKGGPVTVTHPDMRRYFMTIEEAVGLVLLAGLGKYGDLCILDMGEQIKILDLARHMISMAGLVPEQDIPIVFTGLRPGEKLEEELMTEEEEESREARRKIFRVDQSYIPEDLLEKIEELRNSGESADREKIKCLLKKMVPKYRPASDSN
ncbi:MAG TPA: nucleoside-diphosphate sugar epimerase/dehydratase [Acidobacteriota bacterium]|nr:nucleoside-diphosphate sugar epimerase/dehydratase [Acidobacteriota bacterium]